MKKLIFFLLATFVIAAAVVFALPAKADGNGYLAQMTGCTECNSCKKRVVMALAKLDGVTTVRFLKKKDGDLHRVIVETDGAGEISKDKATSALKDLAHFDLKSWKRQVTE